MLRGEAVVGDEDGDVGSGRNLSNEIPVCCSGSEDVSASMKVEDGTVIHWVLGPAPPAGDTGDRRNVISYTLRCGCALHLAIEIGASLRPELEFRLDCKQRTHRKHCRTIKQVFLMVRRHSLLRPSCELLGAATSFADLGGYDFHPCAVSVANSS
jgi:hypothetical protein